MSQLRKIRKLYSQIPDAGCKGLCWEACGPVPVARAERGIITMKHGGRVHSSMDCPYLVNRKCSVYEDRPMLCRLYGVTDDPRLTCPFGCRPAKMLTNAEANELLAQIEKIGGPMGALARGVEMRKVG